MFTAFLTKFRSSLAARSTSSRAWRKGSSSARLSCTVRPHSSAKAARLPNSSRRWDHCATLRQACGVRSNRAKHAVSADGPVVKVPAPAVHLGGRDAGRLVHQGRQHTGLVPAGVPECGREFVIPSEVLGEHLHFGHRHAKELVRDDSEPRQVFAVALCAFAFQTCECGLDLILERELRCLLGRLGGIALPSGWHADSPRVLLQADPILISFSRSVVKLQCFTSRDSASWRRTLPRFKAEANNGSRAWLSRNRRHDSRVHFRAYLPSFSTRRRRSGPIRPGCIRRDLRSLALQAGREQAGRRPGLVLSPRS